MKRLVVDASVAVKWLLSGRPAEEHACQALALLDAFRRDEIELIQPPHWLIEVGAVLGRLAPERAGKAIQLLDAMEIPVQNDPELLLHGIALATRLNHHLFDTLYHAVALAGPAEFLVTADLSYFRKARHLGAIIPLSSFHADRITD